MLNRELNLRIVIVVEVQSIGSLLPYGPLTLWPLFEITGAAQREGLGGGALAPSLFCKNKVNLTKNNLKKITEPKIAPSPPPPPTLKNLLRGP